VADASAGAVDAKVATTRREKAAETEAALKHAAREVFAERGYLNTKITDITAAARRATGSFYNHFAGKEELLEALLRDMLASVDGTFLVDPTHNPDFSRRDSIRWHVAEFWRFYRAHIPEMIALRQAAMVNPELGRRLQQIVAANNVHMVEHLAHLPEPKPDPLLQMSVMNALLEGFAYNSLVTGDDSSRTLSDDEAIDLLTDVLHHGLAGR
jgi:AcrR family transcriptional regulator